MWWNAVSAKAPGIDVIVTPVPISRVLLSGTFRNPVNVAPTATVTSPLNVDTPLTFKCVLPTDKALYTCPVSNLTVPTVDTPVVASTLPIRLPITWAPCKSPLKFVAVTTPVATIPPVELIPTPLANVVKSLLPPTCNVNLGSLVDTPTNPLLYILVNPNPAFISVHCDVGILIKLRPSPCICVALIIPAAR